MAIEAQFYLNNAGLPISGSKNLTIGDIQSCLNSQVHNYKHNGQGGEQQCLQHLQHAKQMNQDMTLVDPIFLYSSNSSTQNQKALNKCNNSFRFLPSYRPGLAIHFDEQREIDHYIRSQSEKLRILLEEQRKQQVEELLKKVELNALYLLKQKDEEIALATKRTTELKEFVKRLEVENQSWRKVAEEKEATVLCLHNTLEDMKERALYHVATGEDAESCCDDNMIMKVEAMKEETGENKMYRDGAGEVEQIRKKTMDCKCCHSQKSCFMFLPCRHLSSCKTCEPFLQFCPVCSMPKKSSMETLIE